MVHDPYWDLVNEPIEPPFDAERTAFLIIDLQNLCAHPEGWMGRLAQDGGKPGHLAERFEFIREIMPNVSRLLTHCRTIGVEVFHVRIAFEMGSLSWEEAGSATRHESTESLRKDAEWMSTRVLREVLAACGSRDVERITVSCNRPLTVIPDEARARIDSRSRPRVERPRMSVIFRASIDRAHIVASADWHRASLPQVGKAAQVEFDRTGHLKMDPLFADEQGTLEPEGELEF